jgi:hypothetical protein
MGSRLMEEDPQYRMWKNRLDSERAVERARADRKAARELERASWYQAWEAYKDRLSVVAVAVPRPRWWNLVGWVRWLLRLHAPGGAH